MIIQDKLFYPYRINIDSYQYTVEKYTGKDKDGNDNFQNVGYFTKLETAMNRLIRELQMGQEDTNTTYTLKEYLEKYKFWENRIKELVKQISNG